MEIKKEGILLELEEVLNTKSFSLEVKNEIKEIILGILEMNIDNKKSHIISIINGLNKMDTIEFNLREELIKNGSIKNDLDPNMSGYVKVNSNLMVVVKEFQKYSNFYHELVHVSQNENSYNINSSHYNFPGIFTIAMREGEAIYYQHKYQQYKFPTEYGESLFLSYHTDFYRICLELYQDMKNILGNELLEKWKNIEENYDIMPEIAEYVKKEYNVRFSHIYNVWTSILYYFSTKYSYSSGITNLGKNELLHQQILTKTINNKLKNIIKVIEADKEYIKIANNLIKAIDYILNNSEILSAKYQKDLMEKEKELLEYLEKNSDPEKRNELSQELKNFTFENYKSSLLKQKNSSIIRIEEIKEEIIEFSKQKELYEWYNSYCSNDLINLDLYSLAVLKTAMLKQINKDQQLSIVSLYAVMLDEKNNVRK